MYQPFFFVSTLGILASSFKHQAKWVQLKGKTLQVLQKSLICEGYFFFRNLQMMLKHHHLLHTFVQNLMGRMGRSHNSEQQVSVEKLMPSRLDQTRNKNDYLYVNSPIPKLSSREVASLVRRTGGTEDNYKQWRKMGWYLPQSS